MLNFKKKLFLLILILCFNSKHKEYNGSWVLPLQNTSELPNTLKIRDDSIHIRHPYYNIWKTYKLKKSRNSLSFNNIKLNASVKNHSLVIGDSIRYYKSNQLNYSPKIELPNLKLEHSFKKSNLRYYNIPVAYIFNCISVNANN